MALVYTTNLYLKIRSTNIGAQKIDGFIFQLFGMALISFKVKNKLDQSQFFQETFLVVDIDVEVILGIFFLTFSNVNI